MERLGSLDAELTAIAEDRACADLSSWRKVHVGGDDARGWLHDLVTADVETLIEGSARRSLLLTPTGRIRADFTVAVHPDFPEGFLLFQDAAQEASVADLLAPYVLSSAVVIEDKTDELVLYAALGGAAGRVGWAGTRPSAVGPGMDVVTPVANAWRLVDMMMKKLLTEVGPDALEAWRVYRGSPRFGVDFDQTFLPGEAGLVDETIDLEKGCFLGQESVAKVRNRGHPPRLVLTLWADGRVERGTPVLAGTVRVGEVTSAVAPAHGAGTAAIAVVRWEAVQAPLTTPDGGALQRVGETTYVETPGTKEP
jgi:tRNA-modifying protein YgfZ